MRRSNSSPSPPPESARCGSNPRMSSDSEAMSFSGMYGGLAVTRELVVGKIALGLHDDPQAIGAECVREQKLSLEPRALDAFRSKVVSRPAHDAADRPAVAHPVSALRSSATARSTAVRSSSR